MMIFERGRFMLELVEDWSQFFQSCNWYTFRLAKIEVEDERFLGNAEITVILVGLGFRLSWRYADTEGRARIERSISEIMKGDEE